MTDMRKFLLALSIGAIGGCGTNVTHETHTNVGHVCVTVGADNSATATVHFDCITGGCTNLVTAECSVELDGTTVSVTSEASTETENSGTCTLECGSPTTECSLANLPDGEYTISYGDASANLSVPGMAGTEVCTDSEG